METRGLSRGRLAGLIGLMLTSGALNSLLSKYQDMQPVGNGKVYEQPVYQTITLKQPPHLGLIAFAVTRQVARHNNSKRKHKGGKGGQNTSNARYSRVPEYDSGVVLGAESYIAIDPEDQSYITLRGQEDAQPLSAEDDVVTGISAQKAVVGPDEIVPATQDAPEKASEQLSGARNALMWLPAIFDICGTTLMNVGLLWVPVSVFQMLRGALVLWVGLFSVLFLHRQLPAAQWCSLVVVMLGVAVVGLSNVVSPKPAPENQPEVDVGKAIIGACLVLFAQVFTASQFVVEEKIMTRYSVPPLQAVGLEGIFGLATTAILMPVLYFTIGRGSGQGGYFDIVTGFHQTFSSPAIWITSLAIACCIAFFNFSGLAVTKSVSATARSLIDTCRTVLIWAVSLFLGWEALAMLQVVGFALLVYGTLLFNEILPFPPFFPSAKGSSISAIFDSEEDYQQDEHARLSASGRGAQRTKPVIIRYRSQPTLEERTSDERTPLMGSPS
ncbi:hypothetical protein EMMF5_003389 [Cystobasidiomycetes sp. EMM_F5]